MDLIVEEPEVGEALKNRPESRLPRSSGARKPNEATTTDYPSLTNQNPTELLSRRRTTDPDTIGKVEAIVHRVIHCLQRQDDTISIALKARRPTESSSSSFIRRSSNNHYKLSFPGNTPQEAWRFSTAELTETVCKRTSAMLTYSPAVVLRILELIHEALVENVVISKRCAVDD